MQMEMRSETTHCFIKQVPPLAIRIGTTVVALFLIVIFIVIYTVKSPIHIKTDGIIECKDVLSVNIASKHIYLLNSPITINISFEGGNGKQQQYKITTCCRTLKHEQDSRSVTANIKLDTDRMNVQIGQKVNVQISVTNKTLWQQLFKQ